ncbi:hypothetical protein [Kitasatospora sp. NPDC006786]
MQRVSIVTGALAVVVGAGPAVLASPCCCPSKPTPVRKTRYAERT